jgi:hypothetical protein
LAVRPNKISLWLERNIAVELLGNMTKDAAAMQEFDSYEKNYIKPNKLFS